MTAEGNGLTVARGEHDVVRVFTLAPGVLAERSPGNPQLPGLLGVNRIDPAHLEIIDTADIAEIGLAEYLTEGYGAVEAQIAADAARLNAVRGHVLIATSAAFPDRPAELLLDPSVGLVGAYAEDRPEVRFETLPSASAEGVIPPPPAAPIPSQTMRLVRMVAYAVAALLVVLILVRLLAR